MADAITRGESIGFLKNETEPQNVLYVDFENGEASFRSRFSEVEKINGEDVYFNEYKFDEHFHFVDLVDGDQFEIPKGNAIDYWLVNIDQYATKSRLQGYFYRQFDGNH